MLEPKFHIKEESATATYGKYSFEPLEQGYGHTLGVSIRRVLLSSLKGAAITKVKIDGAKHQFSTLPGLKEDVIQLLLNIKKVRIKLLSDKPVTAKLNVKGITKFSLFSYTSNLNNSFLFIFITRFFAGDSVDKSNSILLESLYLISLG